MEEEEVEAAQVVPHRPRLDRLDQARQEVAQGPRAAAQARATQGQQVHHLPSGPRTEVANTMAAVRRQRINREPDRLSVWLRTHWLVQEQVWHSLACGYMVPMPTISTTRTIITMPAIPRILGITRRSRSHASVTSTAHAAVTTMATQLTSTHCWAMEVPRIRTLPLFTWATSMGQKRSSSMGPFQMVPIPAAALRVRLQVAEH